MRIDIANGAVLVTTVVLSSALSTSARAEVIALECTVMPTRIERPILQYLLSIDAAKGAGTIKMVYSGKTDNVGARVSDELITILAFGDGSPVAKINRTTGRFTTDIGNGFCKRLIAPAERLLPEDRTG